MNSPRRSVNETFVAGEHFRVDESGCWIWQRGRTGDGYGSLWLDGRPRNAHRVSYESQVGPIPAGLTLDHLCRTRACVNPDHLEPVTHRENVRRGASGFDLTGKCLAGKHDMTDPANVRTNERQRRCVPCDRVRNAARMRETRRRNQCA